MVTRHGARASAFGVKARRPTLQLASARVNAPKGAELRRRRL
jgi:hypothetical protein